MEQEISLINKVELRIALAGDDKAFESALNLYLAPLLLKLASPHAETRRAIIKIIQHLIPRIGAARSLKLPIEPLLEQVKDPKVPDNADPSTVRLYSLLFISKGIDRLTDEEKQQLVPKVVEKISTFPSNVSARLFNILCKLLNKLEIDSTYDEKDADFLVNKIGKFLMLQPSGNPPSASPGLSVNDILFFNLEAGVSYQSPQEIYEVKLLLLNFIKNGFTDLQLLVPLLIASVDSSSSIKDSSEILFRKLKVDFEDPVTVDTLANLFVGTQDTPAAKPTLQERIMQIFVKSKATAAHLNISTISKIGLSSEYSKLKQLTIQFIKWVSTNKSNSTELKSFREFNIAMISDLRDNLLSEGWPQIEKSKIKNFSTTVTQRLLQYEAMGNILRENPELFTNDIAYVEFLFESLEGELPEMRATIQEALSSLTVHLPNLSENSKSRLKHIARGFLISVKEGNENIHSCRYVAIKFVNCTFPFSDSEARYLCLLGASKENRTDTIEEAMKGLHPHWFNILQSGNTLEFKATSELLGQNSVVDFPSFESFIRLVFEELKSLKGTDATIFRAYPKLVEFALQILVMQSIKGKKTVVVPDEEWSIRLEKAIEVDTEVQSLLKMEINAVANADIDMENASPNPFHQYLLIIFDSLVSQSIHIPTDISYASIFTRLVSSSPPRVIGNLVSLVNPLLELLNGKSLNDLTLSQISKAFGIIASHPSVDDSTVIEILNNLTAENVPKYSIRGKILASSYLIARLTLRKRLIVTLDKLIVFVKSLLSHYGDTTFVSTVLESLYQMSIFGVFGPIINEELKPLLLKAIEEITPKVKKCDEKSILTFAALTLAIPKTDDCIEYENLVYETHVSKQVEFTFTSGEAFLILTAGWQSKHLQRELDIEGETVSYIPENITRLPIVLKRILQACANTKPSLRKAGCIWLLSLVQYCGHLDSIKENATDIHVAFMRFLADKDELVQESASRGLSLVYEMGDRELKDTLVHGLLSSFTDSNSASKLTAGSIENDTQLFEPDLLKTNDGSVSTYKDVLSLANEVGDTSLVYKFMSLAKSSALWSSRKGIAFGLGSILSKSSLDELLTSNKTLANRLIPKLFRYKYDPNSDVQRAMVDIWNALVSDTSKTVRENYGIISQELLKGMGNKEWRVRQASASGLNDLLQIVPLETYENKMEEIWNMSFRVMDDIKESVRKEGTKLTKNLATTLTKTVDIKHGGSKEKATEVLTELIPFLLGNKGLLSDSEDVKNFALETILKLCKVGGEAIKPFVPKLINNFINLMSTLEPEVINYLILNADKYNIKNNDIDAKRLQSLGQSPMMDAIEKLMKVLDDSIMDEFIKKLESSVKRSVGLPSKVSGSKVLVTLITKHYELAKPYGDKLLKISIQQLSDRNDTIASSYAVAAGYLCRISSLLAIIDYSKQINQLYFESEDDKSREIASVASESVSKYAGDKFDGVSSAFLPLAFIGKHDSNKVVRSNFEREWIENTSGNNNSVKLYLTEILAYFRDYNTSNRFDVRKTLGKSISNISDLIDNLEQFSPDLIEEIIQMLIQANKGKSWDGKELLFGSLVSFAIKAKNYLEAHEDTLERINNVVKVEAKRKTKSYQIHSVQLLGKYINIFHDEDLIEKYIEIMEVVLKDKYYKVNEDDASDSDSDDDAMEVDLKSKIDVKRNVELEDKRLSILKNLEEAFFTENYNHELLEFILEKFYNIFHSRMIDNTWRTKIMVNETLNKLLSQIKGPTPKELQLIFKNWKQLNDKCLNNDNIENTKVQFIRLSKTVLLLLRDSGDSDKSAQIITVLKDHYKLEASNVVKTEIDKVTTV